MRRVSPLLLTPLALAALALTACGGNESSAASGAATTSAAADPVGTGTETATVLIDVRTPEEFAAGHLEGALNYNVEDGTLESVLKNLDPSANYSVYCRSGRRSALAAQLLNSAGFASVADLGSVEDAAQTTGLPVVAGTA
jgi:rhodanese-related sulfurtransferase